MSSYQTSSGPNGPSGPGAAQRGGPDSRGRLDRRALLRFGALILTALAVVAACAEYGAFAQTNALERRNHIGLVRFAVKLSDADRDDIRGLLFGLGLGDGLDPARAEDYRTELDDLYISIVTSIDKAAGGGADQALTDAIVASRDSVIAFVEASQALEPFAGALADPDAPEHVAAAAQLEQWQDAYDATAAQLAEVETLAKSLSDDSVADGEATGSQVKWLVSLGALAAVLLLAAVWRKLFRSVDQANAMQAEIARVSSMVENSPAGMLFCDEAQVVRYVNPTLTQLLGRLGAAAPVAGADAIGRTLDDLHGSTGRLGEVVRSGQLPHTTIVAFGAESVEVTLSQTRDDDGRVSGTMASWTLITDEEQLKRDAEAARVRERAQAAELQAKVDEMVGVLARAAAGDLTVEVPVAGNDAMGQMGRALGTLLGDLRGSISTIASNSEALASAAEELQVVSAQMGSSSAEASDQLALVSGASTEVSRNVSTVSAGAEEMSASIKEIARNASDAARVASQAVDAARATNETVAQLGESSAEIGAIVKVITGIAQQTNLLALNATIEAARAGEAGKGFAVVANEVKDLAKETAQATDDIAAKIGAIQSDTQRSVESITGILAIIDQIAEFQDTIASAVEEQAATTSEIARSVNDASRGSTEITANLDVVARAAESTAGGAADSQRAATDLARMASDLQRLVGAFTY